jgi:hypothetical protein
VNAYGKVDVKPETVTAYRIGIRGKVFWDTLPFRALEARGGTEIGYLEERHLLEGD